MPWTVCRATWVESGHRRWRAAVCAMELLNVFRVLQGNAHCLSNGSPRMLVHVKENS
jgi:hypothetical protein